MTKKSKKKKRLGMRKFYRLLAGLKKKGWKAKLKNMSDFSDSCKGIRLASPQKTNIFCHCPITAVCVASCIGMDQIRNEGFYNEAAKKLGITPANKRQILCAADGDKGLTRSRFLKALDLKEAA